MSAASRPTTARVGRPSATTLGPRVAGARAWLGEFFTATDDGGAVRLAEINGEGWREYARGVRPGLGLDALARALVHESEQSRDIFACPYLHPGPRRRAGGAVARRHVHADIDGPLDLSRVRAVGGMAVASGSVDAEGRPHGHVYVRLASSVSTEDHTALCTALGAVVGGEHHDRSKTGDADMLRPAGTLNHKRGQVAAVRWLIGPDALGVRTWEPEALARLLGLAWPLTAADEPEASEEDAPVPRAEEAPPARAAARLDGLARSVTFAPPGEGNARLNWAAGKAAALWTTETDRSDADTEQIRAELVAAYMGRPVPAGETAGSREREARRTVASGWRWGIENPDRALATADDSTNPNTKDESETVIPSEDKGDEDDAEFWGASLFYRSVLAFARERRVGPWALLGAVLANASASVPPGMVLPPTIGGVASLNLFVALCSESGGGKSAAMTAARDFLDARGGCAGFPVRGLGSGEGLLSQYVYVKRDKGQPPKVVQRRLSVLFDVDEVGALGALAGRNGATLLPFLKTAWSGADLGTANAEAERDRQVEAHAYRLALVAGVQPVNAGLILDDEGGGFPQRWLWMPTHDPRSEEATGEPVPWDWSVPGPRVVYDPDTDTITAPLRQEMPLPGEAVAAMLEARDQRDRPIGAPLPVGATALDGHALLTRAKVAALLALLHGRTRVGSQDWQRAGDVLTVSDRTRAAVAAVRGNEAAKEADRKAQRAGRSAAIAADAEVSERTARAVKVMLSALEKREGEHSASAVRRFAGSRYKEVADEALDRLTASGLVEVCSRESTSGRREVTTYYRWRAGT